MKKNRELSELRKYIFLDKTIFIKFPRDWFLSQKDENLFEIKFPHGPYPVLGCYVNCFDGPKINTEEKIKKYLLGETKSGNKVEKKDSKTFFLHYEFNAQDEKLIMWKVLNYLEPRSFREIRLSLSWPNNKDANHLVGDILNKMKKVLANIDFNPEKTEYDNLAVLNYKLQNIKLKKYKFWDSLHIFFPIRWTIRKNKSDNLISLTVNEKEGLNLFFEFFNIDIKKNIENNDSTIKQFLEEITHGVTVSSESLIKSDNNNYIFSFVSNEILDTNEVINRISYRMNIKETKLLITSFVFSYKKQKESIGTAYYKKIDNLIKSSELI